MGNRLIDYYNELLSEDNIQDNIVYIESHVGNDLAGNMYYLAREFLLQDKQYIIGIASKGGNVPKNVRLLIDKFGDSRIKLLEVNSVNQVTYLAIARYLFTDVQFNSIYRKRHGQVCVQTWHGTPLKKLGYDFFDDVAWTGAQKKSFIDSDIVLYPNKYTQNNMNKSYRLESYAGRDIILGYPRNSIFFDSKSEHDVRLKERLINKKVFAYMPTWRGNLGNIVDSYEIIKKMLDTIDNALDDGSVMYVNLHRLMREKLDFTRYYRVKPFPDDYETYEFLNCVDCLITDYSSVMIDFLCTRKKIILWMYDKDEYLKRQGMYLDIESLPFAKVKTIEELLYEMGTKKEYDDAKVYKQFCSEDEFDTPRKLYQMIIDLHSNKKGNHLSIENDKKRYLFYGGDLSPSDHTTDFIDWIDAMLEDKSKIISVAYKNIDFIKEPLRIQALDKKVDLISLDYYCNDILFDSNNCEDTKMWPIAYQTQFHGIRFEKVICYINRYDEMLRIFTASNNDVTFVIDERNMEHEEIQKIKSLAYECKASVVNDINSVKYS
ncbi:CDP-glycerol glycerophosphotransferase family protein [Butyrivibrio sp. MB2005]|uniref:CDP-glycerol glycerophosphotransferase family protein n=1 Tax=Butyrivibrio sp. MB2005 TaxID=1280678 RepID=UPI000410AA93|nr:CDP-glycerol glycerophosphotransferase family protein [Butyrivibrio sp. MB2005]